MKKFLALCLIFAILLGGCSERAGSGGEYDLNWLLGELAERGLTHVETKVGNTGEYYENIPYFAVSMKRTSDDLPINDFDVFVFSSAEEAEFYIDYDKKDETMTLYDYYSMRLEVSHGYFRRENLIVVQETWTPLTDGTEEYKEDITRKISHYLCELFKHPLEEGALCYCDPAGARIYKPEAPDGEAPLQTPPDGGGETPYDLDWLLGELAERGFSLVETKEYDTGEYNGNLPYFRVLVNLDSYEGEFSQREFDVFVFDSQTQAEENFKPYVAEYYQMRLEVSHRYYQRGNLIAVEEFWTPLTYIDEAEEPEEPAEKTYNFSGYLCEIIRHPIEEGTRCVCDPKPYDPGPPAFTEPPPIRVTADGGELTYSVGQNKWNGAVCDRRELFEYMTAPGNDEFLNTAERGTLITVDFPEGAFLKYISCFEVEAGGNVKAPSDLIYNHTDPDKISFPFSPTQTEEEWLDNKTYIGCKMLFGWDYLDNEVEYAFIVYNKSTERGNEPPEIRVLTDYVKEIPNIKGINSWNGVITDRSDILQDLANPSRLYDYPVTPYTFPELTHGTRISVDILDSPPDEIRVYKYIISSVGKERMVRTEVNFNRESDDSFSFTFEPTYEYDTEVTYVGYRMFFNWNNEFDNEVEYVFIITFDRNAAIEEIASSLLQGISINEIIEVNEKTLFATFKCEDISHPVAYSEALYERGYFEEVTFHGYKATDEGDFTFSLTLILKD